MLGCWVFLELQTYLEGSFQTIDREIEESNQLSVRHEQLQVNQTPKIAGSGCAISTLHVGPRHLAQHRWMKW